MNGNRWRSLWPAWRRRQEHDMREELDALSAIAGNKELGNLTLATENARATWGWTWLGGVAADFRYAARSLRGQKGFLAVAVLSLALAIGANSAVFSFADAALLRPLPVPDASGVFDVTFTTPDNPFEGMSFPDYRNFRTQSRSFSGLVAYRLTQVAAATEAAAPARIRIASMVSDNFFPALRVAPAEGRTFLANEADQPVAMITTDFGSQYGGDQPAVRSTLHLNGIAFRIVGIVPKWFTGLDRFTLPTIYIPLGMSQRLDATAKDPLEDRARHNLNVKGRLNAGASPESAQAEMATLGAALERAYPASDRNRRASVTTELKRRLSNSGLIVPATKMLMGLVGLVLLIACSNLANLLLARSRARSREIAIRLSIGAGRLRLIRQLMTESLLVALLGGAVGLIFAYGGIQLLGTISVPSDPPAVLGVQLDWRIVEFSFLAALASCLIFGLAPAWQSVRLNFVSALKDGGHGGSGTLRTIGRDILVAGQIALAMVVLIAAGLFLAGFQRMVLATPEFRVDHVITMDTGPAMIHYTPEQTRAFYRQLVDRARTLPGVADVAMTECLPLAPSQTTITVVPEGYQFPAGREKTVEFGSAVDAGYFRTMRVRIERGRDFNEADRADTRRVAIVNRQFAKTYWPNQDPIGKRVRLNTPDGPEAEVVGVAQTGHYLIVNEPPSPYVYVPYEQNPRTHMTLIVQTVGDPSALAPPMRDLVRSIDANVPVFNLRTVATLYESRATGTWLEFFQMVGTMGCIGLTLATVGLYGLVAYSVSRRVKEFGIRVALGARRSDVVWMVERRGLMLAAIGIALGGVLTKLAVPLLSSGFVGLGGSPSAAYLIVPLLLLAVSAVASYVPARRAAGLDPLHALRDE
jgi:predicted permease